MRTAVLVLLAALALGAGSCYKEPRVAPPPTALPYELTPLALPVSTLTPTPEPTATVAGWYYVIQEGDTLWSIAQQFGTSVDALVAANDFENPDDLPVGAEILVPLG